MNENTATSEADGYTVGGLQFLFLLVIMVVVIGGAIYGVSRGDTRLTIQPVSQPAAQSGNLAAVLPSNNPTNSPEPTATPWPTNTPLPTRDLVQEAKLNFVLTEGAATSVAIMATQAQEQAEAAATQVARQTAQAALDEQNALNISAAKTAVFEQATAQAERKIADATATAEWRAIERQSAETRNTIVNIAIGAGSVLGLLLLALLIWLASMKINDELRSRKEASLAQIPSFAESEWTPVDEREVVQVNHPDGSGATQYEVLTRHEKSTILRQLSAGRRIVLNEDNGMIPLRNGFSRSQLESIIKRLIDAGLGVRRGDGALEFTDTGYQYFGLQKPEK